jgi:hypothetical protein
LEHGSSLGTHGEGFGVVSAILDTAHDARRTTDTIRAYLAGTHIIFLAHTDTHSAQTELYYTDTSADSTLHSLMRGCRLQATRTTLIQYFFVVNYTTVSFVNGTTRMALSDWHGHTQFDYRTSMELAFFLHLTSSSSSSFIIIIIEIDICSYFYPHHTSIHLYTLPPTPSHILLLD